jgi:hypothetical protein
MGWDGKAWFHFASVPDDASDPQTPFRGCESTSEPMKPGIGEGICSAFSLAEREDGACCYGRRANPRTMG